MKLYLGVDGGQSATAAVIGDETGRILGTGEAGPCNHAAAGEGRAKVERAVTGSLAGACAQAGLDARTISFEAACFGMSGGPEDKQEILAGILRTRRLIVTDDAVIALAGATATGQGIITISGTGSIAFGRNASGQSVRAGGWGYIFGDEGSGFYIARQATRAVLRAHEGWGPATNLRDILFEATGTSTAYDLLHLFYTDAWPRSRVAKLARLVDAAADSDSVAAEIIHNAAQQLALLAGSVRAQLWPEPRSVTRASGPPAPVQVAYIGGVFESVRLRSRFQALVELQEGVTCGPPLRGPAEGALLEAMRASA
jgi:N-acetylglucosamine kinase-like BadF-type ATPase